MIRRQALGTMLGAVGMMGINPASFCSAQDNSMAKDWPCLYGSDDGVVCETALDLEWNENEPKVLWKQSIGTGYSQPIVVADMLYLFHRRGDEEILECMDSVTQKKIWSFARPTAYVDRYGYNGGPRSTPIFVGDRIFALGAEGNLYCVKASDGTHVWTRKLNEDFGVEQAFFGVGGSPWLENDRLIINAGGKTKEAGIVAIQLSDGKTLWQATDHGASYATPRGATIHGKRHVFVFTDTGLVDVDPADGKVRWNIPFRSKLYESVNATSPLVVDDTVLVSATYRTGALAIKIKPDGSYSELWRKPYPDSHFSNWIHVDGFVYGFSGRHENGSMFFCCELSTGKVRWKHESILGRGQVLKIGNEFLLWGERGHLATVKINPNRLEPGAGKVDLSDTLRHPTWTPPAISRGKLYLRNESSLVCCQL